MHKDFDLYLQYIEANKSRLTPEVYEFASSQERYNLNSPHSLHDAWLTSFTVKESRQSQRPFEPNLTIEIVMLGPMHDRDIGLAYQGVRSYRVEGNKNPYNWADTYHADVANHEVSIAEDGCVVHEIEFVSRSRIVVICENFTCTEYEHT